jgi:hypothetical protein
MRTGITILVAWLTIAMAPGVARADTPKPTESQKRADALFAEGRKLIEAHDDVAACQKFREAIALDPDAAGTMLNLGLCNENLRKFKSALYWFRKAQARAHETNLPEYEKAAGDHTRDLASAVATVKIEIAGEPPPGAKVKIDGEEIRPDDYLHAEVDPGHHALDAGAPGHKTVHQEFDVVDSGGATPAPPQTLSITLVPGDNTIVIDRGATRRKAALVTAAGGTALLIASGIVAFYGREKYNGCLGDNAQPPPLCPLQDNGMPVTSGAQDGVKYVNHYHTLVQVWGTGLFVAGAAAVGVGAYLYFTAPSRERIDRTVFLPTLGPDQIGLAATGRF